MKAIAIYIFIFAHGVSIDPAAINLPVPATVRVVDFEQSQLDEMAKQSFSLYWCIRSQYSACVFVTDPADKDGTLYGGGWTHVGSRLSVVAAKPGHPGNPIAIMHEIGHALGVKNHDDSDCNFMSTDAVGCGGDHWNAPAIAAIKRYLRRIH